MESYLLSVRRSCLMSTILGEGILSLPRIIIPYHYPVSLSRIITPYHYPVSLYHILLIYWSYAYVFVYFQCRFTSIRDELIRLLAVEKVPFICLPSVVFKSIVDNCAHIAGVISPSFARVLLYFLIRLLRIIVSHTPYLSYPILRISHIHRITLNQELISTPGLGVRDSSNHYPIPM